MLFGQITLVLVCLFAGAALYISVAEQPARLSLDDRSLLAEWRLSYRRAAKTQAGLVVLSGALGLAAAWLTHDWRWIVGAALILINGPYTLLGIMPTNKLLQATAAERADDASRAMIKRWGRLHAGRTALGFAAILADLWALH
ncbi:MAG: DUF1772 domain-containing protein [Xanthobacteraceae bacterium]